MQFGISVYARFKSSSRSRTTCFVYWDSQYLKTIEQSSEMWQRSLSKACYHVKVINLINLKL